MSASALLVSTLLAAQRPSGAFGSVMHDDEGAHPDENTYVTAAVLAALADLEQPDDCVPDPRLATATGRALHFLETAQAPGRWRGYRFWPPEQQPARVPPYPPDADDTALTGVELARHGRIGTGDLRRLVAHGLLPHRVRPDDRPAPWVRTGAFLTWLDPSWPYNVVDCTVNANVVTLICRAGLQGVPGYAEACGTIADAVQAAGSDSFALRLISPYYAGPWDLLAAVRRAVRAGADELVPVASALAQHTVRPAGAPVCTSAYGRVRWTSPLLTALRESGRAGSGQEPGDVLAAADRVGRPV